MASFRRLTEEEFIEFRDWLHFTGRIRELAYFLLLCRTGLKPVHVLRLRTWEVWKNGKVPERMFLDLPEHLGLRPGERRIFLNEEVREAVRNWILEAHRLGLYGIARPLFAMPSNLESSSQFQMFRRILAKWRKWRGLQGRIGLPSLRAGYAHAYLRRTNGAYRKLRANLGLASLKAAKELVERSKTPNQGPGRPRLTGTTHGQGLAVLLREAGSTEFQRVSGNSRSHGRTKGWPGKVGS